MGSGEHNNQFYWYINVLEFFGLADVLLASEKVLCSVQSVHFCLYVSMLSACNLVRGTTEVFI